MKPVRVLHPLSGFIAGIVLLAAALAGRVLADGLPAGNAPASPAVLPANAATDTNSLQLLTTPEAVRQLKRGEAARNYPVKIQGVVICIVAEHGAFVLQGGSNAVWVVNVSTNAADLPRAGDFLEVQGVTD